MSWLSFLDDAKPPSATETIGILTEIGLDYASKIWSQTAQAEIYDLRATELSSGHDTEWGFDIEIMGKVNDHLFLN